MIGGFKINLYKQFTYCLKFYYNPKLKTNIVHFLDNFRKLNNQLKRKPYLTPKINGMLLKLEGF